MVLNLAERCAELDRWEASFRKSDAEAFWKDKKERLAAGAGDAEHKKGRVSVAYVTNGVDPGSRGVAAIDDSGDVLRDQARRGVNAARFEGCATFS